MGTKTNPGQYDCYAKAKPNEELFTLLERDEHFAHLVRYWAWLKTGHGERWHEQDHMAEVRHAAKSSPKVAEALACADRGAANRILRKRTDPKYYE